MPSFTPVVFYRDPMAALRWLEQAFGFETSLLVTDDDGRVGHAEMSFGDGHIGVGEEWGAAELIGPAKMRSPASLDGVGHPVHPRRRWRAASTSTAPGPRRPARGSPSGPPTSSTARASTARSIRKAMSGTSTRRSPTCRYADMEKASGLTIKTSLPGGRAMDVPPISPLLFYRDAKAALDFLERAFGFETRMVVDDGQGGVIHSESASGPRGDGVRPAERHVGLAGSTSAASAPGRCTCRCRTASTRSASRRARPAPRSSASRPTSPTATASSPASTRRATAGRSARRSS